MGEPLGEDRQRWDPGRLPASEGAIPEQQNGGGRVLVPDIGTYTALPTDDGGA